MLEIIKNKANAFIKVIIGLSMIISMMSLTAFAETTSSDVIEIRTVEELYNVRLDLSADYILMNDIDLSEATAAGGDYDYDGGGWNPIGSSTDPFSGTFDGNGYSIIGMRINNSNSFSGLFGNSSGTIKNVHIKQGKISSGEYTGAIAGASSGDILNCSFDGTLYGNALDNGYVGGIVGKASGSTSKKVTIENCYTTPGSSVRAYTETSNVAGIVGAGVNVKVVNCYNAATVESTRKSSSHVRFSAFGILGGYTSSGVVENCYNRGKTTTATYGCYAIASSDDVTITNCYYLSGTGSGDGTSMSESQMKVQSIYGGFDFDNVWILDANAEYPYPQLRSNLYGLSDSAVEMIRIVSFPTKTQYWTNEALNFDGGLIEVVYFNGNTEVVQITKDMVSGYSASTLGTQTLTVKYAGCKATYDIEVIERPAVTSIELISEPNVKEYVVGTSFDFTGGLVKVVYAEGTTKILDLTEDMTTGGNINQIGSQTITVTVDGKSTSFDVEVIAVSITGIEIKTLPTKVEYYEGDEFDTTGMSLVAKYTNGKETAISSGYTIEGYESTIGTHTITVSFAGKSASFDVEVKEKTLESIKVTSKPKKLTYYTTDELNTDGMVITAVYVDGSEKEVTDYEVSQLDGTPGNKVITVTYQGKSASFNVTVNQAVVERLFITSQPTKTNYIEGEPLSLEGLEVSASYDNGTVLVIEDYEVGTFDSSAGTQTILLSYKGKTASFTVTVVEKTLVDIKVEKPTKTDYIVGETFDTTGLKVLAVYNSGEEVSVDGYTMSEVSLTTPGAKEVTITYGDYTKSFIVNVTRKPQVVTNGAIKVETIRGRSGVTSEVNVTITKNPGLTAFAHTIKFDPSKVEFVNATAKNGFKDGEFVINDEQAQLGVVKIVWVNPTEVSDSKEAYTLEFKVKDGAEDGLTNIEIEFEDNDNGNANGQDVLFDKVNGGINVLSYGLGDVNDDKVLTMDDQLLLAQYLASKEMNFSDKQLLAADVNEDGTIDVHDATLLSQWLLDGDI